MPSRQPVSHEVVSEQYPVNLAMGMLSHRVLSGQGRQLRQFEWMTEASIEDVADMPVGYLSVRHAKSGEAFLTFDDGRFGWLSMQEGSVTLVVAGDTKAELERIRDDVVAVLPVTKVDDDVAKVPVQFWALSPTGPQARSRMIDVPPWTEIDINYAAETRQLVQGCVDLTPGSSGQLLLWRGEPGTGKTFALRALAWEWRKWCRLHYITDPDKFFSDEAYYMLDVLTHEDESKPIGDDPRAADGMWRLLVLEDAGELLSADARQRSGKGIDRLLNVVDGLIGQGLRIMVLVTTNEEAGALNEAIQRPGRCAANVEFEALGPVDIAGWAAALSVPKPDRRRGTLAELYADVEGRAAAPEQKVGF